MTMLIKGASAYLRGFKLIHQHGLWLYFWIPVLLSLVLGGAVLNTAWLLSDDIGGWLLSFYPWEWGSGTVESILNVMSGLVLVIFTFMIFRYLIMAIASPFMSLLSERLEAKMYPDRETPSFSVAVFFSSLIRGIRIALRNIIRELFFTLLIFILGIIIPILSPAVPFLILALQAFYAGFGNMDFTLERHFGVRESVRFAKRNRMLVIGNGLVFVLLLMTIIGFLFALPLGTAAGAVTVFDKLETERK